MELTDHLRAVRQGWWIVALCLLVTVGAAVAATARATPVHETTTTFYVAAASETGTALQADEFAQRRINSYVGVLTSERLAEQVVAAHGLDLTPAEVAARISAVANAETILLTATVQDTDPDRALAISRAVAAELEPFVQELERTDAASQATVSLTVLSGPTLSDGPVSPRPMLNIGVGILVGGALGVALAIARQMLDRTVRSPEDLKDVTGLPTLATVDEEGRRRPGAPATGRVAVGADPGSPRAEAYRRLRTNLMFSAVTSRLQVVVVTSAVAGEGKTTTAANLAVTLAEDGRRVLLVDADLRRPQVADYLGIEGRAGLTNVLAGQVGVEDVIQQWGTERMHVLPAGTVPPNPSELLGSTTMATLVDRLRGRFDLVVIDTPPVLPVTDASVLATRADSLVLVVRSGRTSREDVRTATESLRAVEAPLMGTILNGGPPVNGDSTYIRPERPRRLRVRHARRHRRTSPTPTWTPQVPETTGRGVPETAGRGVPETAGRGVPETAGHGVAETAVWLPVSPTVAPTAEQASPTTYPSAGVVPVARAGVPRRAF